MSTQSPTASASSDPSPAGHRWLTADSVLTTTFVVALVATGIYTLYLMRGLAVIDDDLLTAQVSRHLSGYIEPYGNTLAVIPIAMYRLIFQVFGFEHYTPLAVVGVVSHLLVALAAFLVVRARVGPALAFVAGVALLWYPKADLGPSVFNHFLALAAIIVCSWALRRGAPKFDVIIAVALSFAFCNSPVAVAGAAGCIAYVALARPPLRRWCAVLAPTAAYALWSVVYNRDRPTGAFDQSIGEITRYIYDGIMATFRGLAFDNRLLGVVLAIAFVALLAWRLRLGVRAARHEVAWTVALLAWFGGLAVDRGLLAGAPAFGPDQFRYRLVGATFIILACLPDKKTRAVIQWSSRPLPAVTAVLIGALLFATAYGDIVTRADRLRTVTRSVLQTMLVANLGPSVVPDDTRLYLSFVPLTAREYRDLVAEFGAPGGTEPKHPDAALVRLAGIKPVPVATRPGECVPLADPSAVSSPTITLRAGPDAVPVRIRRFEDGWVAIGTIRAGQTARIRLPRLEAAAPWMVSAPGACEVHS